MFGSCFSSDCHEGEAKSVSVQKKDNIFKACVSGRDLILYLFNKMIKKGEEAENN